MNINRNDLRFFIELINNNIFSVTFQKKDGSIRKMNCRGKVKKHLKGGFNKVESSDNNYKVVYDLKNKGYRTVNLDTVSEVRFNNTTYKVI